MGDEIVSVWQESSRKDARVQGRDSKETEGDAKQAGLVLKEKKTKKKKPQQHHRDNYILGAI